MKKETPLAEREETIAHEIRNFLIDNINQNFSVRYLANKFEVKPYFLKYKFPTVFKKTLKQFIKEQRLLHAINRLSKGETLKQVSADAGYNSTTTFDRAFKRIFHLTPLEYIEKNNIH